MCARRVLLLFDLFKFIHPVRHRFRPLTPLHCDTPGIIFKNLLILTFGAVMSRSSEPLGTLPPLRVGYPKHPE